MEPTLAMPAAGLSRTTMSLMLTVDLHSTYRLFTDPIGLLHKLRQLMLLLNQLLVLTILPLPQALTLKA